MAEALRIENLNVRFHTKGGTVKALNGVNLRQEEGEIYCLVGESGSGKSTLALTIMGLLPYNASLLGGKIFLEGVDLLQAGPDYIRSLRGHQISMVSRTPVCPESRGTNWFATGRGYTSAQRHVAAQRQPAGPGDAAGDGSARPQAGDGSVSIRTERRHVPASDDGDSAGAATQTADC